MTTYPIRTRRWTRSEYRKLGELGILPEDEPVRQQDPIALDDASEPEPDVVVVPGSDLDYFDDHPARPVLVVEVAATSLYFDRGPKGSAYARAGLPDYWIVNLVDWRVEVYRRPAADSSADLGWRYLDVGLFAPGASIVPLARPGVTVAVSDILPEALRR